MKNTTESNSLQSEILIPYRKGEFWGYCNKKKEIIIPCQYHDAIPFKNNIAWVCIKNKWGTIDITGKEITPCKYVFDNYIDTYLDKVVEDVFIAQANNKYRLIDYSGKELKSFDYDDIGPFKFGLSAVTNRISDELLSGFINLKGEEIIPLKYHDFEPEFCEGYAVVSKNNYRECVINTKGEEVLNTDYACLMDFSDGLACAEKISKFLWFKKSKYGYINIKGEETISCIYDEAKDFINGFACVRLKKKWGVIDKTGKIIYPFKFDEIKILKNDQFVLYNNRKEICIWGDSRGKTIQEFNNQMVLLEVKDEKDNEIDYYYISNLSNEYCNGIIDTKSRKYRDINTGKIIDICNDLVVVVSARTNLLGYVSLNDKKVIPCEFKQLSRFSDGYAVYSVDEEKYGYIDSSGWKLTDCIFEDAGKFENGLAVVTLGENCGYIDTNGIQYWED